MASAVGGVPTTRVVRPVKWLSTVAAILAAGGAAWLLIRANHMLMGVTYSFVATSAPRSPWRVPLAIGALLLAALILVLSSRGPLRRLGPALIAAAAVVCLVVDVGQGIELSGAFGAVGYAFLAAAIAVTWAVLASPRRWRAAGQAAAGLAIALLATTATVILTHSAVKADCDSLRPVAEDAPSSGPVRTTRFTMLGSAGTFANDWEQVSYQCQDGVLVSFSSKPLWAP
jgi:hypothetical protein